MMLRLPPTDTLQFAVSLFQREGRIPGGWAKQKPRHPFGPRIVPFRQHLAPILIAETAVGRENL
jgi:hypothetical protein